MFAVRGVSLNLQISADSLGSWTPKYLIKFLFQLFFEEF